VDKELRRRGLHELRNSSELRKGETLVVNNSSQKDNVDRNECAEEDGYDDDDGWGGATVREEDIFGQQNDVAVVEEKEEEDENDEWSAVETTTNPLGMNIVLDGTKSSTDKCHDTLNKSEEQPKENARIIMSNKLEPISHHDNLKRKSERLQKKQELITAASSTNPTTAAKQQQQPTEQDLKNQQESIRETLKTNEERIAEATYLKLQERLQSVDDLLESLQEEEWAEEEDDEPWDGGGDGGVAKNNGNDQDDDGVAQDATLLDQILAMILGGLPKESASSGEEHYKYLKGEHKSIVKEWKETFGRLPPFPSSTEEQPEVVEPEPRLDGGNNGTMPLGDGFSSSFEATNVLAVGRKEKQHDGSGDGRGVEKKDLTLIDNDESNWDEVEDWDAVFPS